MNSKKGKFLHISTKDFINIILKEAKSDNKCLGSLTKKDRIYRKIIFLLMIIDIFFILLFIRTKKNRKKIFYQMKKEIF